jgi:hypothetical protein
VSKYDNATLKADTTDSNSRVYTEVLISKLP